MNIALDVKNLKKKYGNVEVLKNISFQVKEGEIFGLLGANGAGKSTTLECIEGIKSFNSGSVEIFGKDICSSKDVHKLIGVQLQCTSLQNNITVYEAMKFFCKWQKIEVRCDLLDTFGLKQQYNKQYACLSIGQKRRLHLALALCNNPKIVILDEPTAGLDVEGRIELHKEIRKLKENGVTVILASHDMAEVEMLCDRIAIVVKGEIKALGTARELVDQENKEKKIKVKTLNKSIYNKGIFRYSTIEEKNDDHVILLSMDITKSLSEILEIVNENKDNIIDLNIESLSLEERFIEVINKDGKVS
ncbi:MAG: ABC transporter ATP-binding protein [Clostridium sp.]